MCLLYIRNNNNDDDKDVERKAQAREKTTHAMRKTRRDNFNKCSPTQHIHTKHIQLSPSIVSTAPLSLSQREPPAGSVCATVIAFLMLSLSFHIRWKSGLVSFTNFSHITCQATVYHFFPSGFPSYFPRLSTFITPPTDKQNSWSFHTSRPMNNIMVGWKRMKEQQAKPAEQTK
jgi:hypothetical protein